MTVDNSTASDDTKLTADEYREYCRCWAVFLSRINETIWTPYGRKPPAFGFRFRMTERASEVGTTVQQWPTVWPNVQHVFSKRGESWRSPEPTRRFIAAVQYASEAR